MIVVGSKIHNYEVISPLDEGGMGMLWLAENKRIKLKVVVKTIHLHLLEKHRERAVARFYAEAKILASVQHRHIVNINDFGEHEGDLYYIMPYLTGETLERRLQGLPGGRLPLAEAVQILKQVCEALSVVHALDVVHRDLKPANIFLMREADGGELVKLIDFGIAKVRDSHTTTGIGPGSAHYMAPEQLSNAAIDAGADIYALGAILFRMLSGREVFDGETLLALMKQCLMDPPPKLRELVPLVSARVETLVERCLSKERAERFATVGEFKAALLEAAQPATARPVVEPAPPRQILTVPPSAAYQFCATEPAQSSPVDALEAQLGLEFVEIPAGVLHRGFDEERAERLIRASGAPRDEMLELLASKPALEWPVSAYAISRDPITVGQFKRFLIDSGYERWVGRIWDLDDGDRHPITGVNWQDAAAFCDFYGLRLPTSAEWEYAASGGDGRIYPWGDRFEPARCNDAHMRRGLLPVGSLSDNQSRWGARDLAGNVWELLDAGREVQDQTFKTAVGGSYLTEGRTTATLEGPTLNLPPDRREPDVGFRVCRGLIRAPLLGFVHVPGGWLEAGCTPEAEAYVSRVLGADRARNLVDEYPLERVKVPEFEIARHPVTNHEYYHFTCATQRRNPASWWGQPRPVGYAGRERYPFPFWMRDLPVTQVDLDDALAYAQWARCFIPSGRDWEMAARGPEGRVYPWGQGFDIASCNGAEVRLGRPSAGGEFPRDTTPNGIRDLCGNVTEITRSESRAECVELRSGSWTHTCEVWGFAFVYTFGEVRARNQWTGFRVARR